MPDPAVAAYYERMAPTLLLYLHERRIGVRQSFHGHLVFRRHSEDGSWIHIRDEAEFGSWVQHDTVSFFPELQGEDGILWFALDVDRREQPLEQAAAVTAEVCTVLDEVKIEYLLKFSGHDGFHVLWSFGPYAGDAWELERDIIHAIRHRAEEILGRQGYTLPMTTTDSRDRNAAGLVLIDELILHRAGSIRAPYSLHEARGLVSCPIAAEDLSRFRPEEAQPDRIKGDGAVIPLNEVETVRAALL